MGSRMEKRQSISESVSDTREREGILMMILAGLWSLSGFLRFSLWLSVSLSSSFSSEHRIAVRVNFNGFGEVMRIAMATNGV